MGMTEEAFFAQSIMFWNDRMHGFNQLHGRGGESADDVFTPDDYEALNEACEADGL